MINSKLIPWSVALMALIPFTSCKKDGGGDTASTPPAEQNNDKDQNNNTDTTNAGTLAISTNALAAAFPEGLAITAFPTAVDPSPGTPAAGTVAVSTTSLALDDAPNGQNPPVGNQQPNGNTQQSDFEQHPKEQLQEQQKILGGDSDSCFDPQIFMKLTSGQNAGAGSICFGSDYGIITGYNVGYLDGGKVNPAIDSINQTDRNAENVLAKLIAVPEYQAESDAVKKKEACTVVKARENVTQVSNQLNTALQLFAGMICQAKKDSKADAVPEVGQEVDLTSGMTGIESGSNATTVESAKITRKADQEGRLVFVSEIDFTLSQASNSSGKYKIRLVHSPGTEGNREYNGVLQVLSDSVDTQQNNQTRDNLLSLTYQKTGGEAADQLLKFEVRQGSFVRDTDRSKSDPMEYFQADGRLDVNAVDPDNSLNASGQANQYLSGMTYFAASVNPSTYAGDLSVWNNPGGGYGESARGFVFKTTEDTDGKITGCSWAGAAKEQSIRMSLKEGKSLKPSGCYTPQIGYGPCGNPGDNIGPQVWKQCFAQNDGPYEVDSTKVTDADAGFDILQTAPDDIPDLSVGDIPSVTVQ